MIDCFQLSKRKGLLKKNSKLKAKVGNHVHVLTGQTIRALDHVIALDLRRLMRPALVWETDLGDRQ